MFCFVKIDEGEHVCGSHDHVGSSIYSEHEVEGAGSGVGLSGSVGHLGGFSSGFELALVSNSLTVAGEFVNLGFLLFSSGGFIVVVVAFLEAKLASGTVSLDNGFFVKLRNEEGLSESVKSVSDTLGKDVEGLELNINSIVEFVNSEFSTPGLDLEVVKLSEVIFVRVDNKGKELHDDNSKDAGHPDNHHDLGNSVEEDVEGGVGPSEDGDHPEEGHNEPGDDVAVNSEERRSTPNTPERHLVPVVVDGVHVVTLVDIHVVNGVEYGESSIDRPSHVSSVVHNVHLGLFFSSTLLMGLADKHVLVHLTFNCKNIIV